MLRGYVITRNCEAAELILAAEPSSSCLELSPLGRRISSCRHINEHTPDDRGAQRADNRPGTAKSGAKKTRVRRKPKPSLRHACAPPRATAAAPPLADGPARGCAQM